MDAMPEEIRRVDDREIHITWADGHQTILTNVFLREHCQCASCVHELTGQKLIKPGSIPQTLRAEEIALVGRYAISIRWNDGHSTGIYSFRKLREWCRCPVCLRREG
jgi:DUF971 family protein